jgi:PUA domain protein
MPRFQVDKGAVKFVLRGADIMCPGLTSKGALMDDVPAGQIVAIYAEGKQRPFAIGVTKLSTQDMYVPMPSRFR